MSIYQRIPKKVVFFVMGVFAAGASAVYAFGGHHHDPQEKAGYIVHKITKKLDLTDAQQEKLNIAKDAALAMHQAMHNERLNMAQDIQTLFSGSTLDQQLILNHINQKTVSVREQAPEVVAALAGFYDSLDAQQQEKIRTKVNKKLRHMKKHGYDD